MNLRDLSETGRALTRAFQARTYLALPILLAACTGPLAPQPPDELYERDMSASIHDTTPVRGNPGPLRLHVDEDAYECSICHEGFSGDMGAEALEGEHANITFDHGLNLLCLNCHHPENSDVYVYHDGSEIPGDDPTQLCAKCHGPHYKEWNLGIHGRASGAWSPDRGEQSKLNCIQCHDPHRPAFQPMRPQRPPVNTRFDLGEWKSDALRAEEREIQNKAIQDQEREEH